MGGSCCSGSSPDEEVRKFNLSSSKSKGGVNEDNIMINGPCSKRSSVDSENISPMDKARKECAQEYVSSIFSDFNQDF